MKITRVTTIAPETGCTVSDLMSAFARVGDDATITFVVHKEELSENDYLTIELTENLP